MPISDGLYGTPTVIDTKDFLTTFTVEDQDRARTMWDTYSGAKGLLDATIDRARGTIGYRYNPATHTYTRTTDGRIVTDAQMVNHIRRVSTGARNEMRKEAQQLIAGTIILAVFQSRMRNIMKALYSTIWLVTIGGFLFDNNIGRNLFYLWVLAQYNYLDRFMDDLDAGVLSADGRTVTRAGMYGEAGNGMYQNLILEREQARVVDFDKIRQARRRLGDNENHCYESGDRPGCIELAQLGWMPVDQIVPIGEATCLSNCHCTMEYRTIEREV